MSFITTDTFDKQHNEGGVRVTSGAFSEEEIGVISPSSISGLQLWLDAGQGVYNDSGTTLATNGQSVQQWNDRSSNARNVSQATSGNRPVYSAAGGSNSKPTIVFTGASSNVFDVPNFMAALTAAEAFIIVKVNNDPPGSAGVAGLWKFRDNGTNPTFFPFTDGTIFDSFGTTARKQTVNPTPTLAAWNLYNVISTSSEWTNSLNGTQLFTTGTNTYGGTTTTQIGADIGAGAALDGAISEVIIYNVKLSATDRTNLKAYFSSKYSLTIA